MAALLDRRHGANHAFTQILVVALNGRLYSLALFEP